MLNIDANTLQGLAQLSPGVRKLLEQEMLLALDRLVEVTDPVILHQLQGRARVLRELLHAVEQADSPAPLANTRPRSPVTG